LSLLCLANIFHCIIWVKELENTKVLKVDSRKVHEKIYFSNGAELVIKLDDNSYIGPEAIVLYGPENLIVVWN
jgi:hypothetical protein